MVAPSIAPPAGTVDVAPTPREDLFGFDPAFRDRVKGAFVFLHDRYFRVETTGAHHIPPTGWNRFPTPLMSGPEPPPSPLKRWHCAQETAAYAAFPFAKGQVRGLLKSQVVRFFSRCALASCDVRESGRHRVCSSSTRLQL